MDANSWWKWGFGWAINSSGFTATTSFWCTNCQAGPGSFAGTAGTASNGGAGNCSKGINTSWACGSSAITGGCGGAGGNYAATGNNGSGSNFCSGAAAGSGGIGGAALMGNGSNSILINFGSGVNYGTVTP
ncbi:MAG: hypothetical protein IPK03_04495 [Bacteroidetes bacterium]|nr:hypothetical protein [Bacteroidota bacterium]